MENLYLGVSKKDITAKIGARLGGYRPDIYSTGVHDALDVTAFAFMQGDVRAMMISATVLQIESAYANELISKISDECHVPKENIMISCTHTHSGPCIFELDGWGGRDDEYWNDVFVMGVMKAATEAVEKMIPVTMGYSTGESYIGINRREQTADNTIILGQNPWGPYDPRMTVISFKDSDGACVANMIHFGMHGTCAGSNTEQTQDWAGVMVRRVEALTGGITAFFNGAEGDIGPRLTNGHTTAGAGGNIEYVIETGGIAANDAMTVYRKIKEYTTPTLCAHTGILKLPLEKRISREDAENTVAELEALPKTSINGLRYSNAKKVLASYEEGYIEREYSELAQTVVSLGNIKFASTPYELFCEIAMRIQKECPYDEVLMLSLTNGRANYFPTENQLCRGGYEVNMFRIEGIQPYVRNVDWYFIKETLRNLERDS